MIVRSRIGQSATCRCSVTWKIAVAPHSSPATQRDFIKRLRFTLHQAHRKTDRFIRMFHRAKDEAIKPRLFELAVQNDRLAAEAAAKLKDALANDR